MVRYRANVTTEFGYKLVCSLSIGDIFNDVTWPVSKFKVISCRQFEFCLLLGLLVYYFGLCVYISSVLYAQP